MKKFVSFLLSLILLCGLIPHGITINAYATTEVEIKPLSEREVYYSFNTYLKAASTQEFEQQFYNAAISCKKEKIDVSAFGWKGKDAEYVLSLATQYKDKYTELYHVQGTSVAFNDTDGDEKLDPNEKITGIVPVYYFDAGTYNRYNLAYKQAAAEMIADLRGNKLTDLEKLLVLHDRIAVFCEYDYKNYERYEQAAMKDPYISLDKYIPPEAFTMYGALVNGIAVCEGYSKAYQYMLNELGIENYLCSSKSLNHVWNIVKLNGKYYHVDITFDDPPVRSGNGKTYIGADRTGHVSHKYFLRSTNSIKALGDHNANDFNTAPNDTTYDNYFWKDSNTAFSLLNGEIYYINNKTQKLMRWEGGNGYNDTELHPVECKWNYSGNYACLSADNGHLYYNLGKTVYEYNVTEDAIAEICTPAKEGTYIYGFKAYHNIAYCDITSSPSYYAAQKKAGMHTHQYSYDGIDITESAKVACATVVKDVTYTGKPITFKIDIFAGGKHLVENVDFTVTYEKNVNKGTATLAIHGIGKYTGTDFERFKIKARSIGSASISGVVDKTYTGGKITQTPYITYGGKKLVRNTDYKVDCYNNIATGKATAKITGIGNFSGSVTKYFYIHPKKVEKLKVKKATASSITISWAKAPSGTGYAILRATSKKGTYKTVKLINSRSTVSYTNKKLSKNKTYYYRVVAFKTVGGKKYTSVASSILTAKTATSAPKISYYKNTSSKAVKLKWKKVSGAKGYQVYVKCGSKGKYKRIYSGSKLTYTAKKLKKGKTYYFKVRTYKKSGSVNAYSSYSSVKKVKVKK